MTQTSLCSDIWLKIYARSSTLTAFLFARRKKWSPLLSKINPPLLSWTQFPCRGQCYFFPLPPTRFQVISYWSLPVAFKHTLVVFIKKNKNKTNQKCSRTRPSPQGAPWFFSLWSLLSILIFHSFSNPQQSCFCFLSPLSVLCKETNNLHQNIFSHFIVGFLMSVFSRWSVL